MTLYLSIILLLIVSSIVFGLIIYNHIGVRTIMSRILDISSFFTTFRNTMVHLDNAAILKILNIATKKQNE